MVFVVSLWFDDPSVEVGDLSIRTGEVRGIKWCAGDPLGSRLLALHYVSVANVEAGEFAGGFLDVFPLVANVVVKLFANFAQEVVELAW